MYPHVLKKKKELAKDGAYKKMMKKEISLFIYFYSIEYILIFNCEEYFRYFFQRVNIFYAFTALTLVCIIIGRKNMVCNDGRKEFIT